MSVEQKDLSQNLADQFWYQQRNWIAQKVAEGVPPEKIMAAFLETNVAAVAEMIANLNFTQSRDERYGLAERLWLNALDAVRKMDD